MSDTQYARILQFLRKNKQATVRQLLQFTNYPSARIHEMTGPSGGWVDDRYGGLLRWFDDEEGGHGYLREKIIRLWTTTRDGKKIRLYRLEKVR